MLRRQLRHRHIVDIDMTKDAYRWESSNADELCQMNCDAMSNTPAKDASHKWCTLIDFNTVEPAGLRSADMYVQLARSIYSLCLFDN